VQDRPRSEWGRVFALYLAAFLGAFIIGLTVIGMTATEQSTMTAATKPRAKAAESASGTTPQPMQVVGVKALEPETTPRAAEPSHQGTESRESPAARFKLHPWQTLLALCHQGIDELCRR
jgi:hypothetical protein